MMLNLGRVIGPTTEGSGSIATPQAQRRSVSDQPDETLSFATQ